VRRVLLFLAATFGFVAPSLPATAERTSDDAEVCKACEAVMALALANPRRDEDRARDRYRHPAETLSFFRIRPGMTVVDYIPATGWYTRILAPYLGETGRYIALNPDVRNAAQGQQKSLGGLAATFPQKAAQWIGGPAAQIAAYNTDTLPPALDGSVDRVLIFRELHNLYRYGWLDHELDAVHALLKDNGLLGIVEHRAKPDAPASYVDGNKGYMKEADVIRLVEARGFQLVAKSEVNANPKDNADWPDGVWTLPPTLKNGDADRARYEAIGESDRMTLLFRKRS
jgi:predicted methyltransferase